MKKPKIDINAPNLDAETESDLDEFADFYEDYTNIPDDVVVDVAFTLAEYARVKARAMRLRAAGNILRAGVAEGECEAIFARLPEEFRW